VRCNSGMVGTQVLAPWPPSDKHFFDLAMCSTPPPTIQRVALEDAGRHRVHGPFDPSENPLCCARNCFMPKQNRAKLLCANPDIVVEPWRCARMVRGGCGGAYTENGR